VTERDIRLAANAGCRNMSELTMRTGCGATCGSCVTMATDLLTEARQAELHCAAEDLSPAPAMSHAA